MSLNVNQEYSKSYLSDEYYHVDHLSGNNYVAYHDRDVYKRFIVQYTRDDIFIVITQI